METDSTSKIKTILELSHEVTSRRGGVVGMIERMKEMRNGSDMENVVKGSGSKKEAMKEW